MRRSELGCFMIIFCLLLSGSMSATARDTGVLLLLLEDSPPRAVNDTASVTEDDPATVIDVLANDTDSDGGGIRIASLAQPDAGTVVIANGGSNLTYQPDPDYCNDGSPTDDFTYSLWPGNSTATVAVSVTCVNDPPNIGMVADQTIEEYSFAGPLALTVGDIETAADSLVLTATSSNATLIREEHIVFGGSGTSRQVTVTPEQEELGSATVTVTVEDAGGETATTIFDVTVTSTTVDCTACHSKPPATGSHLRHVSDAGYRCRACHYGAGYGTPNHDNSTTEVVFDSSVADRGMGVMASYDDAPNTCSDIYCHGDFPGGLNVTADWDAQTGGACGDCHSATDPGTNSHPTHTATYAYACTTCHSVATHVNGTIGDITFDANADGGPGFATYSGSAAKQCSNIYCHGDFTGGLNVTADWDAQTGGACGDCHSATDPGTNSHPTHTATYAYACTTCHSVATHVNGTVGDITFDANADGGPGSATYSGSAAKQCSNIYCHGDFTGGLNVTADWDGGTGGACGDCHDNAPLKTSYGSHDKHTDAGEGNYSCAVCHNGEASGNEAAPVLDSIASHANFTKNVTFDNSVADRGVGVMASYDDAPNTCSNIYCHGDFLGGLNVTADWDAQTGGDCGDCHSATDPGTGSHTTHTATYAYACTTCHSVATHVNGTGGDITFDANADGGPGFATYSGSAAKQCSNIYCHGDFTGGLNVTADWDGGTGGACGDCHDNAPLKAAYGSHDKHTDAGEGNYACSVCHNGEASGNEAAPVLDSIASHANFTKNVTFDSSVADRGVGVMASYDDAPNTCSDIYCHGDFLGGLNVTADWDAQTGGDCGDCHSATDPGTNSHTTHTATYAYACTTCHSVATHVNGTGGDITFDANADGGPGFATYSGSAAKQCSNIYCHGDFTGGLNVTADWDGGTGGACGDCHDNAPLKTSYGSHDKHTDAGEGNYSCAACHNGEASGNEAAPVLDSIASHANFTKNVTFDNSVADRGMNTLASFDPATNSCSDIYCHGDFLGGLNVTADWDAQTGGDCGDCHSATDPGTGSHTTHTATYAYACTTCHSVATHVNGTGGDITFDANADGGPGFATYSGSAAKQCSNIYCHGDFTGGLNVTADWDGGTGGACGDCHDNAPLKAAYGSHDKHTDAGEGNYSCAACHNGEASGNEAAPVLDSIASHANFTKNVTFDNSVADRGMNTLASFDPATNSCSDIYCHGDFLGGLNVTADWDAQTGGDCGDCHSATDPGTGSHTTHTATYAYACTTCHSVATHVNGTGGDITFDANADRGPGFATYSGSAAKQCSNIYCHGDFTGGLNVTADWDGGTGGACGDCHDNAPLKTVYGSHDKHTDAGEGNYSCAVCHNGEASGNEAAPVLDSIASHANFTKNVTFDSSVADRGVGVMASYDDAPNTCSDIYCHGDFTGGLNVTADWDAGTGGACGDCHILDDPPGTCPL